MVPRLYELYLDKSVIATMVSHKVKPNISG